MSDSTARQNDEKRIIEALEQLLADPSFARAPQMSAFLRYVVERTVRGESGRIKAYSIGVDALGKPPGFDPQTDPSVRVLAKRLRDRLTAYYAHYIDAPLQIVLRSGSYTPVFISTRLPSATPAPLGRVGRHDAPKGHFVGIERPAQAPMLRPGHADGAKAMPVLYLMSGPRDSLLARRIAFVLSGMLARNAGVDVRRVHAVPHTVRPIDRTLALHTTRLDADLRVDLQLSAGCDGPILQADVLTLTPAADESLGRGDFDRLEGWVGRYPAGTRATMVAADGDQLAAWLASAQNASGGNATPVTGNADVAADEREKAAERFRAAH